MKTMLLVIKFLISSMGRVTFSTHLHKTEQGREHKCCVTDSIQKGLEILEQWITREHI